jgi:hypothetical protein
MREVYNAVGHILRQLNVTVSCDVTPCDLEEGTDVSEEPAASIKKEQNTISFPCYHLDYLSMD